MASAIARFVHAYPGYPFVSPTYPTPDQVIPMALFDVLNEQLKHIDAADELIAHRAVALGYAVAHSPNERKVQRMVEQLQELAYPAVGSRRRRRR